MANGHGIDVEKLSKKVTDLSTALAHLGNKDDFHKLILILKRPGWTTPAEFILASAVVDVMLAQTHALTTLKGELLRGSEAVGAKQ
jgi:long-subunit acyl-CoA synthetase (AMP-forming)